MGGGADGGGGGVVVWDDGGVRVSVANEERGVRGLVMLGKRSAGVIQSAS